jgi:hypothetical protein
MILKEKYTEKLLSLPMEAFGVFSGIIFAIACIISHFQKQKI